MYEYVRTHEMQPRGSHHPDWKAVQFAQLHHAILWARRLEPAGPAPDSATVEQTDTTITTCTDKKLAYIPL